MDLIHVTYEKPVAFCLSILLTVFFSKDLPIEKPITVPFFTFLFSIINSSCSVSSMVNLENE